MNTYSSVRDIIAACKLLNIAICVFTPCSEARTGDHRQLFGGLDAPAVVSSADPDVSNARFEAGCKIGGTHCNIRFSFGFSPNARTAATETAILQRHSTPVSRFSGQSMYNEWFA